MKSVTCRETLEQATRIYRNLLTKSSQQKLSISRESIPRKDNTTSEMTRKCIKKKCTCKFDLAKIAQKDLPWAQLTGSQDITLMPSSTAQEEGGCNCNSLVLMNLGDKFGKEILEAKQIATASNSPHGVLTLDISQETIQALVRFASEGRINLQNLSEQAREEIWQFSISFSVLGLLSLWPISS